MPQPNTRLVHVFDHIAERDDFLGQIPGIVAQAVQEARERLPSHPPFATGSVAHYYAHRDFALASPPVRPQAPEGPRFYSEAHLKTQCRGAFFVADASESAFPVFLASGVPKNDHEFTVYRKGPMTISEAGGQPALFELELDPQDPVETGHGHAFFLIVKRFQPRPGAEGIEVHLVWGFLKDKYTVRAERQKRLGDTDLPPAPVTPKSPNFPPVFSADPMLEIVEAEDGS